MTRSPADTPRHAPREGASEPTERAILVGAPGTPPSAWNGLSTYLGAKVAMQVFAPASEASPTLDAMVRGLEAAFDEDTTRPTHLVAWGLGAVLAWEAIRRRPRRVTSLVLLSPILGPKLARAMGLAEPSRLAPITDRISSRAAPWLTNAARKLAERPSSARLWKRVGLASPALEDELFHDLATSRDPSHEARDSLALRALWEHEKAPDLSAITAPALLVVGDSDRFSPLVSARRLARRLPFGELFVVPGGTHYALLEYPELVELRIEKLWSA